MNDQQAEDSSDEPNEDGPRFGADTKLYQISSDDLADLERLVPDLLTMLGESMNHASVRTKIQRVRNILSGIRWEGLPWMSVQRIEPE